MIRLEKREKPQVLADNAEKWTEELLELGAEEASTYQKGRYNNADVKAAVKAETHGKCAYCESSILHVSFGDIEHILPKKERPELWFEWSNLTLACTVCNNRKRAYFDVALPLIDPYEDEPEDRLLFFGPLVRAAIGDDSAQMTERTLDLNRSKLIERRIERLDHLRKLLEVIDKAADGLKPILIEDFERELLPSKEYTSLSRTIAKQFGFA